VDIELLKTFLEVRKTRHFGRTAENLYLTQAAVSARIKQLESILGTPLFTRYRNNLQLTPSGERLIDHADAILMGWERARADVLLTKKQTQVLSIGGTSGLWDLVLQGALSAIHSTFPTVALRAESHGQSVLIRRLMERTLDVVLLYEPAKLTELTTEQVAQSELVLVSTERDKELMSVINNQYVSVDWGTAFEMSYAQNYRETAPPVLHTTLARIALEFIMKHGGSAYLPQKMVVDFIGTDLFQVEGALVFSRPIYACYHNENRNTELIKEVLDVIIRESGR